MRSAVVVLSGGQDSTTCLGYALKKYDEVQCITFDYGQKHRIELDAAKSVISFFENSRQEFNDVPWIGKTIPHEVIKLPQGVFLGKSPLTNAQEELETYSDHDQMEKVIGDRIEKTFVPMRNAVFLSIAANRAAVHNCESIIVGICQADNANYPDCTEEFAVAAQHYISQALASPMRIDAPLLYKTKSESIHFARSLNNGTYEALAYSHTAYDGNYPPNGKDHASILRAHGFEEANVPDPLVVRAWREGLMDLPKTANYSHIPEEAKSAPKKSKTKK
jgi:7-cyano-7-deazaguanine synthase